MNELIRLILTEALEDEFKSRALYNLVIQKFGEIKPFINIVKAENRHIQALLPLFKKYHIPVPEDNWETQLVAEDTELEACQQGVLAETENIEMYNRLLKSCKDYPDVTIVLKNLQRASLENHLPAFKRCVNRLNNRANNVDEY